MSEVWIDAYGLESTHQVSSLGRIRTKDKIVKNWPNGTRKIKGRILSSKWERNGYPSFSHNKSSFYVHRIVAMTFIENKLGKPDVNHIDGNKSNSAPNNLEWVTKSENLTHASNEGLLGFSKPVLRSGDSMGVCKYYPQIKHVEKDGFNRAAVSNVLSGISNSSGGFWWEYAK